MSTVLSFYGRALPKNLVDFRSDESKKRLVRALSNGTARPYLALSSCFNSQAEPAYCGVTTLAITLNALQIDPQRLWKTPWRWYTEDLLDCCRPLEDIKKVGITMEEFQCLARCNGAVCDLVRPSDSEEGFQTFKDKVYKVCMSKAGHIKSEQEKQVQVGEMHENETPEVEDFLVVSYSRKTMNQSGDGHFSPIAAVDLDTDSVLVLDTARFKYPPYWVPMELMFKALLPLDSATGLSRGYLVLRAKNILKHGHGRRVCCQDKLPLGEGENLPEPTPVYKSTQSCTTRCSEVGCSGGGPW